MNTSIVGVVQKLSYAQGIIVKKYILELRNISSGIWDNREYLKLKSS